MVKKNQHISDYSLVSIVILNWNGAEDTLRCVESVKNQTYKNIEIIVIDNGSENDWKKLRHLKKQSVRLIRNDKNLGFAGGHVSALPHCKGEYIFILNNDALVEKSTIKNAVKRMETDSTIAVVGGRSYMLNDDGVSSGFYSYQRVDPSSADVHTYGGDDGCVEQTVTVSGSAALIRRSIIDTVGYFDRRFFAYYEETDLFALYLRAGYKIVYDPSVIIQHKDGASTRTKRFMYYYLMLKNQYLFAFKNFDSSHLKGFIKIHFRHFLRSLWLCLKDGKKVEAIHKARVSSTVWNWLHLPGTVLSRVKRLSINKNFNYSALLEEQQPIECSVVIDARSNSKKEILSLLESLARIKPGFKEALIITKNKYSVPKHKHTVSYKIIVDKGTASLSQFEFGLMSSNANYLFFVSTSSLQEDMASQTSRTIVNLLRKAASSEHKIILDTHETDDFNLTSTTSSLIGIEKSNLVNFLSADTSITELGHKTLSQYLSWLIMSCEPILKTNIKLVENTLELSPQKTDYPILTNRPKWLIKRTLRNLHLTRVIKKIGKLLSRSRQKEATNTHDTTFLEAKQPKFRANVTDVTSTPVFINLRDRVEPLKQLVTWLEKCGIKNIYFVDNDSTYEPLVTFLANTPHQVIELGRNGMHKAPWESFAIRFIAKEKPYIVSDPDITPTDETPTTTINRLYEVLAKYPQVNKVGVALKIDDIPEHYALRDSVIQWESRFWEKSLELEPNVFKADVDTTLALYRPGTWWFLSPSARIAGKYSMRHEPWYQSLDNPTEDMLYYRARASSEVSTWVKGKLPKHHLRALKKEGLL